jgi:phosphatidylserine/phosphatidylglycerophosphate/cardiolipin synthase-like enzyme
MAASNMTCTTPIALNQTNTGTIAMKWFVDKTEYRPTWGTYKYLVNGEDAFGAVYDAISKATKTVDIICWGFQPSMYFKRGKDRAKRIGELLSDLDNGGKVKVRLLCWHDDVYVAALSENNMPGYDGTTDAKGLVPDRVGKWVSDRTTLFSPDYQTNAELAYDAKWYHRANLNNATKVNWGTGNPVAAVMHVRTAANNAIDRLIESPFKNLELATRGFSVDERAEIYGRLGSYEKAQGYDPRLIAGTTQGMTAEPTHHQKMVLIDYEDPDLATGFVMGHNMLDQYWDTKDHSYKVNKPEDGRSGPSPWQDISGRVTGPILQYLNANFCEAWDDATGQSLTKSRAHVDPCNLKLRDDTDNIKVMAQVLRTQSPKGKEDIGKMYLQAVNNATQYIFFQNQYFRWQELGDKIKEAAKKQVGGGRDAGKHGPIYLFVITNSSTAAVGNGTVSTYQMLDSLGYGNSMPGVAKLERADDLDAQQRTLETQLAQQQATGQKLQSMPASPFDGSAASLASAYQQNQMDQLDTQQKIDDVKKQKRLNEQVNPDTPPTEIPGLKIQICTLVAPDSPAGRAWTDVYVHAKVMTIDDAFVTQGSANINTRSMKVDSELNFCSDNGDVAKGLRLNLFGLHTIDANKNALGLVDTPKNAFMTWANITDRNKTSKRNGGAPVASLIAFLRVENDRSFKD